MVKTEHRATRIARSTVHAPATGATTVHFHHSPIKRREAAHEQAITPLCSLGGVINSSNHTCTCTCTSTMLQLALVQTNHFLFPCFDGIYSANR
jgi:hypothetical protein